MREIPGGRNCNIEQEWVHFIAHGHAANTDEAQTAHIISTGIRVRYPNTLWAATHEVTRVISVSYSQ